MSYHRQYFDEKILIPDLETIKSRLQNLKIENIGYDYKFFNNFKTFIKNILENEYVHRSPKNITKCTLKLNLLEVVTAPKKEESFTQNWDKGNSLYCLIISAA